MVKIRAKRSKARAPTPTDGKVKQRENPRAIDTIRDKIKPMMIKKIQRPVDENGDPLNPVLPPDLTALTDECLGRLFSEFACMAQYVKLHLAVRIVEVAEAKRSDKIMRARVRLEKTGTVEDKAAKVEVDPRTRKTSMSLLVDEGTETMTAAIMETYLIGRDACSREMSRRQRVYDQVRQ